MFFHSGIAGNPVLFNENGDAPGRYEIYQYQIQNQTAEYKIIGHWTDQLHINVSALLFYSFYFLIAVPDVFKVQTSRSRFTGLQCSLWRKQPTPQDNTVGWEHDERTVSYQPWLTQRQKINDVWTKWT